MGIELLNIDCMEYMATQPDNAFDLAIVDPPYGINFGEFNRTNKDAKGNRYKADKYKNSNWDAGIPNQKYFDQLFRVSKEQIIWGGNYFPYIWNYGGKGFIYWHKGNPVDNFSDGELAWTSFDKVAKQFAFNYYGNVEGGTASKGRIHPTQKPVKLYEWLLTNYAEPGQRILDTHLGSGSSAIAAHYFGCDFVGCEIDPDYYQAAKERFDNETRQIAML